MNLGIVIWTIIGIGVLGISYLLYMEIRDL